MPMRRSIKETYVQALHEKCAQADAAFLGVNGGLTVAELSKLRSELRDKSILLKVAKNTLLRQASAGTAVESLKKYFKGSTLLILSRKDPVAPSKALKEFLKNNKKFSLKAAMLEGKEITLKQWESLAELPGKPELTARLLGAMTAPVSNFLGFRQSLIGGFLGTLTALKEKMEKGAAA